ncbi:hypothetical protein IHV12_15135 [Fictibacillus sp. 7GRE50]|uniref:DUF6906 family protein n=1 Tax=Fictibacillus sp. 7GRE50 TaxID=2745878 RepID=UPI0018CEB0CD|nr:hypothetical protein [Fictibacillus sp. 7GRE50]MBH0166256.1 hypothetical protein [Fictibacillus sp. 7GRE50]
MKNGKRLTRQQKGVLEKAGLNSNNWLIYKNINGELHLIHRDTGNKRIIKAC